MIANSTVRAALTLALCSQGLGVVPGANPTARNDVEAIPLQRGLELDAVNFGGDEPEVRALREVQAPDRLIRAVQEQLRLADTGRRLGISASATIGLPGDDPGTEVLLVLWFASACTLNRPEAARAISEIRA